MITLRLTAAVLLAGFAATLTTAACGVGLLHPESPAAIGTPDAGQAQLSSKALGRSLAIGDLVFIRIGAYPFRQVADATGTWTNHVGIVLDVSGPEPVIGESRFPLSGSTSLSRFVARSAGGRIAVMRLPVALTSAQQHAVVAAAQQRRNVFYDTGFDLHSRRQFCSRYVREVLLQATGIEVGRVEDFRTLLARKPDADLAFWRAWYFGNIPWQRQTVTPASLLSNPGLKTVFDGNAI